MENPFVYGEVVPAGAFVDRQDELKRLAADLVAGQKVFLISPRRYGKSSLISRALASAARRGLLTVEVTVSSYSSYLAFLEGYTRTLLTMQTGLEKAPKSVTVISEGKSWFCSASAVKRPTPSMLKSDSVTIAPPPIRTPKSRPNRVITGISELRSTCLVITRRWESP